MRIRGRSRGQSTVEYILTTLMLLVLFTTMYGVMQGETRKLFKKAGTMIIASYF